MTMAERLNFREACQQAGVSRQRLNEAIKSGRLPATRGGGPRKPTYIQLEDLQRWCVSEKLAMPVETLERSERLKPEDLTLFLERFYQMAGIMERLERTVEYAIERLERSQAQPIEQRLTPPAAQPRSHAPRTRSAETPKTLNAPGLDREQIIARIRQAKDLEGKSLQQIANEFNAENIPTFSGRDRWEKGNVGRFYRND